MSIYPRISFITWTFFPPRRGENCVGFEMTNNFYLIRSDSRLQAPSLYRSSIPHFKISFGCITKSEIIAKLRTNDFDISTSCHEVSDVKARPSWIVFPTRWSLRRRGNAMTTSKDIVRSVSSILLSQSTNQPFLLMKVCFKISALLELVGLEQLVKRSQPVCNSQEWND